MEPGDTSAWKELPFLAEGLLTVVGEVRRTLSYNGTVDIGACGLMLSSSTFQSVGTNHGCSRFDSSFTPGTRLEHVSIVYLRQENKLSHVTATP